MLKQRIDALGTYATMAFAFFIPISTAMTNISMGVAILCWLSSGQWERKRQAFLHQPLLATMGLFLLVCTVGILYSEATWSVALREWSERVRWVYVGILLWFLQTPEKRSRVITAFLCAMMLTLLCGFLKMEGWLHLGERFSQGAVFKDHIKTNFLMAFAAFFLFHRAVAYPKQRWFYGVCVSIALYYGLLLSLGRTGYVMFFILLILAAYQHYRWRGAIAMTGVFVMLLGASAWTTGALYARSLEVYCESIKNPDADPRCMYSEVVIHKREIAVTSTRLRTEFIKESWGLFQAHPWFGTGTGSFGKMYTEVAIEKGIVPTQNPHNAYLYVMVEYGVVGLLALLAFFGKQALYQSRLPRSERHLAQAILIAYFIGCAGNSWLIDFTELHFWLLLLALAYHAPKTLQIER